MGIKNTPPNPRDLPYQVGTINGSPHAIQFVSSGGVVSDAAFCHNDKVAAYFVHSANAYPRLIDALRLAENPLLKEERAALLLELGESIA